MKYTLVELGSGGKDAGVFYGACVPEVCSDDLISKTLSSALKIIGAPF